VACYRQWRSSLVAGADGLLVVDFELEQHWLPASETRQLAALYYVRAGDLHLAVTDHHLTADDSSSPGEQFARWVSQFELASVRPGEALELLPEIIPKPWGREIWYSAVEARGVCQLASNSLHPAEGVSPVGRTPVGRIPVGRTPIPWLQAVLPGAVAGAPGQPLVLLKILDPAPRPVTGDLYFELHEEKREVYVVIHVDESVWPDGVGYIRYGFDPGKLAASPDEQRFRADYLAAVQAYERVRRQLDGLPEGVEPTAAQQGLEQHLRDEMDAYTCMQPLRVGDVVVVPTLLPHSLQHGVRTIEFQTPVYERKILSFAQQVLTQDHWDTPAAVDQMLLVPPVTAAFDCLRRERGVLVERIVDFPDFEVRRVRLEPGASIAQGPLQDYGLVIVTGGELVLDGRLYKAEQALLLPRAWQGRFAPVNTAQPLVLLLALPRA